MMLKIILAKQFKFIFEQKKELKLHCSLQAHSYNSVTGSTDHGNGNS